MNHHATLNGSLLFLLFLVACGASASEPTTPTGETASSVAASTASASPTSTPTAPPTAAVPASTVAEKPSAAPTTDVPIAAGLSQEEIAKAVESQGKVFDPCYKTLGKKSASVKVRATVGPAGQVNAVELIVSNSKNAKMDTCVIEGFKKIKFPSPHGSSTATITFPMDFGPLERVP
jgi:hypothetical protein